MPRFGKKIQPFAQADALANPLFRKTFRKTVLQSIGTIAFFARPDRFFALAAKLLQCNKSPAFQASSPKLSKGSILGSAHFFGTKPPLQTLWTKQGVMIRSESLSNGRQHGTRGGPMTRTHHNLPVSRRMQTPHTCSDRAAICMAVPAFSLLLLGFWLLHIL